jgi:PAS domain S-box-containing protein
VTGANVQDSASSDAAAADAPVRYRSLLDAMDVAVFLMRGPACVVCNRAGAHLFGVDASESLVGKTLLNFAPEYQPDGTPSAQMVEDNFAKACSRGSHAFEWWTTKASGEPIVIEVRFTTLPATADLYLCTATEISERKRAEQALRDSEARFRTLFEAAVEGILVADIETARVRFANPALCEMLGYVRDELLGRSLGDIHPAEHASEVLAAVERHLRHGEPADLDTFCLRKDGSCFPVAMRGASLTLGGREHMACFLADTTSRCQLENERLRTQKVDAIGRLAGGIAHDFNNLLQGVFGFLSLARLANENTARCMAMLGQAEKALQQAVHLTTQLLTFSKGGQPVKKPIDIGPLVRSAASFALSGSSVDSIFEIEDHLAVVDADEGQITQVVQNIVLNAAQAMPLGGTVRVVVQTSRAPGPGMPLQLAAGSFVAISVADTGVGIPPQYLSKLFDPYFTTKDKGTGLGLATSYAIVKNHRGHIDVQSVAGQGSTVTVYLPVSQAGRAADAPRPRCELRRTRAARVLVMDDDPVVLHVTALLLRSLGHQVDTALEGASALEIYRSALAASSAHNLVVLNLTVRGGMGGVETARKLREIDPAVRLVVSSGYSDEAAAMEVRKLGCLAFLKKPFDASSLQATLEPLLRSSEPPVSMR